MKAFEYKRPRERVTLHRLAKCNKQSAFRRIRATIFQVAPQ